MALDPFPVDDLVPGEEEVAGAVRNLILNRSGRPFGMRVDHLRNWQRVATQEEFPDPSKWMVVVRLIQAAFPKSWRHGRVRLEDRRPDPKGG